MQHRLRCQTLTLELQRPSRVPKRTTVVGLGVRDDDVVQRPAGFGQLLTQRFHVEAPKLFVADVHQSRLVFAEDQVAVVCRPILQPAGEVGSGWQASTT